MLCDYASSVQSTSDDSDDQSHKPVPNDKSIADVIVASNKVETNSMSHDTASPKMSDMVVEARRSVSPIKSESSKSKYSLSKSRRKRERERHSRKRRRDRSRSSDSDDYERSRHRRSSRDRHRHRRRDRRKKRSRSHDRRRRHRRHKKLRKRSTSSSSSSSSSSNHSSRPKAYSNNARKHPSKSDSTTKSTSSKVKPTVSESNTAKSTNDSLLSTTPAVLTNCTTPLSTAPGLAVSREQLLNQIKIHKEAQAKAQAIAAAAAANVPKYYNPSSIDPVKLAEQNEKRKLLWSKKPDADTDASNKTSMWATTSLIAGKGDSAKAAKFRKLMGIHDDGAADGEAPPVSEAEALKRAEQQAELFRRLENEYEVSRALTHTQRGIGLGFNNVVDYSAYSAMQPNTKDNHS